MTESVWTEEPWLFLAPLLSAEYGLERENTNIICHLQYLGDGGGIDVDHWPIYGSQGMGGLPYNNLCGILFGHIKSEQFVL